MHGYLIGEVCHTLGVKPHVLRYWEQHVPLLNPQKDHAGRRIYTSRELQVLFRLRYLIGTRRFTTEGAARKIIEEIQGGGADLKAGVHSLREGLLSLSRTSRVVGLRAERARMPDTPDGLANIPPGVWAGLTVNRRIRISDDLSRWRAAPTLYAGAATGGTRTDASHPQTPVGLPVYRWRSPQLQQYFPDSAGRLRVAVAVVAGADHGVMQINRTIRKTALELDEASSFGITVTSLVVAAETFQMVDHADLLRLCSRVTRGRVPANLVVTGSFPLLDGEGRYGLSATQEGLASYRCPLLFLLRTLVLNDGLLDGCDAVMLRFTDSSVMPVPLLHLLGWFDPRRCDAVGFSIRDHSGTGQGVYRRSGAVVLSSSLISSAVSASTGIADRVNHRLFKYSTGTDDTISESMHRFRIRPIDLLTRARRPRMFSLGDQG